MITKKILVKILSAVTLFFETGFSNKMDTKATIYAILWWVSISECSAIIKTMKKKMFSLLDYSIESLQNEKDFDNAFEKKLTIIKLSKKMICHSQF